MLGEFSEHIISIICAELFGAVLSGRRLNMTRLPHACRTVRRGATDTWDACGARRRYRLFCVCELHGPVGEARQRRRIHAAPGVAYFVAVAPSFDGLSGASLPGVVQPVAVAATASARDTRLAPPLPM